MAADFLVLGTPNYHGSYSGILKMHESYQYGLCQNETSRINR